MLFSTSSLLVLGTALLSFASAAPSAVADYRDGGRGRGRGRGRDRDRDYDYGRSRPGEGLTEARLPSSCLPPPSSNLRLKYLTIGAGTQNYTCGADPSAAPVPLGAVADLFEASSAAARGEAYLADRTRQAYFHPDLPHIGEHYFNNANPSRPVFELEGDIFVGRRADGVSGCPAPTDAFEGQDHEGAVDWLRLVNAGDSRGIEEVYRVVTAGGKAPATCEGLHEGDTFEVGYSTQYWMYG